MITGIFSGLWFIKPTAIHGSYEKNCKMVGGILTSAGFLVGFLAFYMLVTTPRGIC